MFSLTANAQNPNTFHSDNSPIKSVFQTFDSGKKANAKSFAAFKDGGEEVDCSAVSVADNAYELSLDGYSTTESVVPDCWTRLQEYTATDGKTYPCITTDGITFKASKSQLMVALPQFSQDINTLQLSFKIKGLMKPTFEVGIISDLEDTAGFTSVYSQEAFKSAAQDVKIDFSQTELTNGYIAIKYTYKSSSQYASVTISDIVVEAIPDCPSPTSIVAEDITENSANISWVDSSQVAEWIVYYKATDGEEWQSETANEENLTLTGLESNTNYQCYVIASSCNYAKPSETITFKTEGENTEIDCLPISVSDSAYELSLDGYSTTESVVPDCWTRLQEYTATDGKTYPCITTDGITFKAVKSQVMVALPQFAQDINKLQLNFKIKGQMKATFDVGIIPALEDTAEYTSVYSQETFSSAAQDVKVDFSKTELTDGYIVIKYAYTSSSIFANVTISDIVVQATPDCPSPTSIVAENITDNSANISWVDSSLAEEWIVYYKSEQSEEWQQETVMEKNLSLTGLEANTTYQCYVIASYCDNAEPSETITFQTECTVIEANDYNPYFEDFQSELQCWTLEKESGMMDWGVSSYYYYEENPTFTQTYYGLHHFNGVYKANAITPVINISQITSPHLTFAYQLEANPSSNLSDKLYVYYRTSSESSWTQIVSLENVQASWIFDTVVLPEKSETLQIKFTAVGDGTGYGVSVDKISIFNYENEIFVCPVPTNLMVTDSTETSVTVSWSGEAEKYAIVKDDDTEIETQSTVYTFNDLQPATSYSIKVRAICDNGVTSEWSDVVIATTKEEQVILQEKDPIVSITEVTAEITSATLNATVEKGTKEIVASGFRYKISTENVWNNEQEATINEDGTMTAKINGLNEQTDYVYYAFVKTEDGKEFTSSEGTFTTKKSSLYDADNSFEISLFPNPTSSNSVLTLKNLKSDANVILTDAQGRVINTQIVKCSSPEIVINAENLPSGVYFVKVNTDEVQRTFSLIIH